jgi:hypothetical protein
MQIVSSLVSIGFPVHQFNPGQLSEKNVPADVIFAEKATTKVFGLQHKALYGNGQEYWVISEDQYEALVGYSWIHYCLSDLRHGWQLPLALELARFCTITSVSVGNLTSDDLGWYERWGSFVNAFIACRRGQAVGSEGQLRRLLGELRENELEAAVSLFIVSYEEAGVGEVSPVYAAVSGSVQSE